MNLPLSVNDLELLHRALLLLEAEIKTGMKCSIGAVDPESCRRTLSSEAVNYIGVQDLRGRLLLLQP